MATMTLDEFTNQLQAAFGDTLKAAVLYGSAATSDKPAKQADYNVLVLLDRFDARHLAGAAAMSRAWTEAGNPAPLTMTVDEWRNSADIFPMEYADILERHRVLYGTPPFDVQVNRRDLRLQLEQEAMGKVLKLRQGALAAGGDGKAQLQLLERSLSSIMVVFRSVLRLHEIKPAEDRVEVVRQVAGVSGIDARPFERVVRHARGENTLASGDAGEVLAEYLDGMQRLVAHLDTFVSPGA